MPILLTEKLIADLAERYEFGTPREKRQAFDKLKGHGEEALRMIERLSHAKVTGERTAPGKRGDIFDEFDRISGGKGPK